MSRFLAPIAFSKADRHVFFRSLLVSIMFMIPMPPTTSESQRLPPEQLRWRAVEEAVAAISA